jgi:hypothetical protein
VNIFLNKLQSRIIIIIIIVNRKFILEIKKVHLTVNILIRITNQ